MIKILLFLLVAVSFAASNPIFDFDFDQFQIGPILEGIVRPDWIIKSKREVKASEEGILVLKELLKIYEEPEAKQLINIVSENVKKFSGSIEKWFEDFTEKSNKVISEHASPSDVIAQLDGLTSFIDDLIEMFNIAKAYAQSLKDKFVSTTKQGTKREAALLSDYAIDQLKQTIAFYDTPLFKGYLQYYVKTFAEFDGVFKLWLSKFIDNSKNIVNNGADPAPLVEQLDELINGANSLDAFFADINNPAKEFKKVLLQKPEVIERVL